MKISRRRVVGGAMVGAGALALGLGSAKLIRRGASIVEGQSRAKVLKSNDFLPEHADVVIVGGGITGACTALCLAERGLSVAICEKGAIAGEASGRAAGWIESSFVGPAKIEIVTRAKQLWQEMNERVGADTGYRQTGILSMFGDEDSLGAASAWVDSVKGVPGLNPQILDGNSVNRLVKSPHKGVIGALFSPDDAIVDPRIAAPVIVEAARNLGATVHQACAVRGIETSAGSVSAVVTEKGVIKTNQVVLAGGVWSTLFCRNLGLELPQLQAFASSMSIEPLKEGPAVSGGFNDLFWRNQSDGGYLVSVFDAIAPINADSFRYGLRFLPALKNMWSYVQPTVGSELWRSLNTPTRWELDSRSPFEDVRIFEPLARADLLTEGLKRLGQTFPAFQNASVRELWGGALVSTPDNMPVLSNVTSIQGLTLGTGLYYGFTKAPAVGELLADLVMGQSPKIYHQPYRYERFIDGSKLVYQH